MAVTWEHFYTIAEHLWVDVSVDHGHKYYRINEITYSDDNPVISVVLHEQYLHEFIEYIQEADLNE